MKKISTPSSNKKDRGARHKRARTAAAATLAQFKGKNIQSLNEQDVKELLTAILQLLALADDTGKIV